MITARLHCDYRSFYINVKKNYGTRFSSITKNIVVFPARSRVPAKFICCIAFVSALGASCLLNSIEINLIFSLKYC